MRMIGPGSSAFSILRLDSLCGQELTIFLVQFFDFPGVPATQDDIIVELVPECQASQLWAREPGDRAQDKPDDDEVRDGQQKDRHGRTQVGETCGNPTR